MGLGQWKKWAGLGQKIVNPTLYCEASRPNKPARTVFFPLFLNSLFSLPKTVTLHSHASPFFCSPFVLIALVAVLSPSVVTSVLDHCCLALSVVDLSLPTPSLSLFVLLSSLFLLCFSSFHLCALSLFLAQVYVSLCVCFPFWVA